MFFLLCFLLPLSLIFFFEFPFILFIIFSYGCVDGIERGSATFRFHQHTMTTVTAAISGRAPLLEDLDGCLLQINNQEKRKRWENRVFERDARKRCAPFLCFLIHLVCSVFHPFFACLFVSFSYFLHLWFAAYKDGHVQKSYCFLFFSLFLFFCV